MINKKIQMTEKNRLNSQERGKRRKPLYCEKKKTDWKKQYKKKSSKEKKMAGKFYLKEKLKSESCKNIKIRKMPFRKKR